jgi:hypothetical protein
MRRVHVPTRNVEERRPLCAGESCCQQHRDSMALRFRDPRIDARTMWLVGQSRPAGAIKQFRFDA